MTPGPMHASGPKKLLLFWFLLVKGYTYLVHDSDDASISKLDCPAAYALYKVPFVLTSMTFAPVPSDFKKEP